MLLNLHTIVLQDNREPSPKESRAAQRAHRSERVTGPSPRDRYRNTDRAVSDVHFIAVNTALVHRGERIKLKRNKSARTDSCYCDSAQKKVEE